MTDIYQPNAAQQLQMLKQQTKLTGGLHDAQVLQLKMWPLVVFDTCTGSKFTWDPDKKQVVFTVEHPIKKMPKLEYWKQRITVLNGWVQTLLGDEWCIQVKCNGKVFNGQRSLSVQRDRSPQPG